MNRNTGPRRARSFRAYLIQTRVAAFLALVALAVGVVSDFTDEGFWARHSLLAGLVSSVLVVMVSVAVINEILERRRRQRWSILAQYVMFELVRNARMFWLGVVEAAGLLPTDVKQRELIAQSAALVRDTSQLSAALRVVVEDQVAQARLRSDITAFADHSDEVLSRWAAVMLNAELYAEIIDRHVELVDDITWISALLDVAFPPDDIQRQRRARSIPAEQIDYTPDTEWIVNRIVIITQLAEALDRGTLELALQIVPVEWWESRLGTVGESAPNTTIN